MIMRKSAISGMLVVAAALFFAPADTAQAKEVPADGNIPLTSEYFPDEWFLRMMQRGCYDKNGDGFLSPEETAAVTRLQLDSDLSDFSQIKYFTNLRELKTGPADENDEYDFWMGDELDLTAFPNLEVVDLHLDSRRAPANRPGIEIKVSGLEHLRYFSVYDRAAVKDQGNDGSHAGIEVIDFCNTEALEHVHVSDVKGVVFDDVNQIKCISLKNVAQIPFDQISGFEKLEDLSLVCPKLKAINVKRNTKLSSLTLDAELLKSLDVTNNTELQYLSVSAERLSSLNLGKNKKLIYLFADCSRLSSLNLSKNKQIEELHLQNTAIESLDLSKQPELKELIVTGNKKLTKLDLSKNKKVSFVNVSNNRLRILKSGFKPKMNYLDCSKNKLTSLDLSNADGLSELKCDKKVKVKGYQGKITRV